jgi:hypothetical protein
MSEKKCSFCNTPFTKTGSGSVHAKYCSLPCRLMAYKKRHSDAIKQSRVNLSVVCSCCGKEFFTTNKIVKYCSQECSYEMRLRKNRNPIAEKSFKKTCPVCKDEFVTENKNRNYCSDFCREEFNTVKREAWQARNIKLRLGLAYSDDDCCQGGGR